MDRGRRYASFGWLVLSIGFRQSLDAAVVGDTTVTVEKIVIIGNETTKDYVILREMSQKVGAPLDSVVLERDEKQIYSLQLFNRVDIDDTLDGNRAIVFVRVSERWYIFPVPILGFKYHDFKKPFFGAALMHQNFRGRNEKILASAVFGYDRWFNLSYQNPKITDDDDIFVGGSVAYSHVSNLNVSQGEYDQKVIGASTTVGKRFGLYVLVLGSAGYSQWDVSDPQPGRTLSATGRDRFISLGGTFIYDKRDIREYPLAGTYDIFSATKFGFGESETNLFRYGLDLRGYEPLGGDVSLCGRAFGSFLSGGAAPFYMHSYFGYDDRIRGYFSTVFEGEDILGGSIELRVPILKPRYYTASIPYLPPEFRVWRYGLYAAVFTDAGTTWFRTDQFSKTRWHSGYGAGLHFLLPYSVVIRTEYALNQFRRGEFIIDFETPF